MAKMASNPGPSRDKRENMSGGGSDVCVSEVSSATYCITVTQEVVYLSLFRS